MKEFFAKLAFGQSTRMRFYAMMRDFVKDGVPVYDALKEIEAGSKKLKFFPPEVISDLMMSMRGRAGKAPRTLGESLKPWVDPVEAALIDAGEQSGRIADGLNEVTNLIKAQSKISATVIGSMIYPVALLLLLGVFLWMVSSQIIPVMSEILPREKWPTIGRVLGVISDNSWLILGAIFGSIAILMIAFFMTAGKWTGPARDFFDRYIPPWSIARQMRASMILTSISMLMEAGVPVSSAMGQLHAIGSPWQRVHMEHIQGRMRRGMSEADAIAGNETSVSLFDPVTAWEIRMYGARSSFATTLRGLSERAMERITNRIKSQFAVMRNLLLVLVAAMLGITFGSFMQITMAVGKQASSFQ